LEEPAIAVRYDSVGSGKGTTEFLKSIVDFGASDAGLSDQKAASVSGGALQIPITAGSVVVAYNPQGLPKDLKLSRSVLADIFLGKVTRWDDERIRKANPEAKLPQQGISVVVRHDPSGTTFAFTNHLAAISDGWREKSGNRKAEMATDLGVLDLQWPGNSVRALGNGGVAAEIQRTPYSLGYVQYGVARKSKLALAALENKAGNFVRPTGTSGLETLLNANLPPNLRAYFPDPEGQFSYPIVTFTWVLIRKHHDDRAKAQALKDFVTWCLTRGQDFSEAAGNIRLAPHIVRDGLQALDSMSK
jgi:phosphate transport system substrate-binding protein